MTDIGTQTGTVELWLRNDRSTITCTIVNPDESVVELDVHSFSMRAAMREMTGWMLAGGWRPIGRWVSEVDDALGNYGEAVRSFRRLER